MCTYIYRERERYRERDRYTYVYVYIMCVSTTNKVNQKITRIHETKYKRGTSPGRYKTSIQRTK